MYSKEVSYKEKKHKKIFTVITDKRHNYRHKIRIMYYVKKQNRGTVTFREIF